MAYNGSVELISGIVQANGQDFALVDAPAVRITDEKRLDEALQDLQQGIEDVINKGILINNTHFVKEISQPESILGLHVIFNEQLSFPTDRRYLIGVKHYGDVTFKCDGVDYSEIDFYTDGSVKFAPPRQSLFAVYEDGSWVDEKYRIIEFFKDVEANIVPDEETLINIISSNGTFYEAYVGHEDAIYLDVNTQKTYHWDGNAYVEISKATDVIDDTAGNDITDKTWSANKLYDELELKAPKESPVFTGSISLGRKSNTTIGGRSIVVGYDSEASGNGSQAEGSNTKATAMCSHAEGSWTEATGANAHAEGSSTKASADSAHAEGNGTTASETSSHAEGSGTTASGKFSHSEGNSTTAFGRNSHAEGYQTQATGEMSHAEGWNTIANRQCQHAGGIYNVEDAYNDGRRKLEIIGNGSSNNSRSNARALDFLGNEYLKGSLYVDCDKESLNGEKVGLILKGTIDANDNTKFYKPAATDSLTGTTWTMKGYPTAGDYQATNSADNLFVNASGDAYCGIGTGDSLNPLVYYNKSGQYMIGTSVLDLHTNPPSFVNINDKTITFNSEPETCTPDSASFIAWFKNNATQVLDEYIPKNNAIYIDTITNKTYQWTGTAYIEISVATDVIDDTAGDGNTDKTWSADKIYDQLATKVSKTSSVFLNTISMNRESSETPGLYSVALGEHVSAKGKNSFSQGYYTSADGEGSNVIGAGTIGKGKYVHVFGMYNVSDAPEAWTANTHYYVGNFVIYNRSVRRCKTEHTSGDSFSSAYWDTVSSTDKQYKYVEIVGNGTYETPSNARALDWDGNEYLKGNLYIGCNANSTNGEKVSAIIRGYFNPEDSKFYKSKVGFDGEHLKNTKWFFNDELTPPSSNVSVEVNYAEYTPFFRVNGQALARIWVQTTNRLGFDGHGSQYILHIIAYENNAWKSTNYKTIEFTDEPTYSVDASVFFNWLQANAIIEMSYEDECTPIENAFYIDNDTQKTYYWTGTAYTEISKATDVIDDTSGNGDTSTTWSADKLYDTFETKAPKMSPVFTNQITIGNTTITEAQLIELLKLIPAIQIQT